MPQAGLFAHTSQAWIHTSTHASPHARPCRRKSGPIRTSPSMQAHPRRSIRDLYSCPCMQAHPCTQVHLTPHVRVHTTACMQVHPHQVSPSVQLPHPRMSIGSMVHVFDLVTYICTLTSYFQYTKRPVVTGSQPVFQLSLKVL